MIVFAFPGQGAQTIRMGAELYERHAGFRAELDTLDAVAKAVRGRSVIDSIMSGGAVDDLVETHPGLFMIEYAIAMTLLDAGVQPDAVIGASLGEIVAAAVAGAIDPHAALAVVIRHAEVVTRTCEPGGMVVVVGTAPDPARWGMTLAASGPPAAVYAGTASAVRAMVDELQSTHVPHQELPVRFGFHSSAIAPAVNELRTSLEGLATRAPRLRIVSSATGGFVDAMTPAQMLSALLGPMHVPDALRALPLDLLVIDCGPSPMITTTARRVLPADRYVGVPILAPSTSALEALQDARAAARDPRFRSAR